MTFDHPLMLAGLAAAAIPLLVHLLDRRKARPIPFAAIDFVLRSQRRSARRLRLRRILLFAARTSFLVAVPLALARPRRAMAPLVAQQIRGPAATAIILDGSLAMHYKLGSHTLFEISRALARRALASLGPEEPVLVMVCKQPVVPPPAPGFDRAAARSQIDRAEAGYAPVDLGRCLSLADGALSESPLPARRIYLASAFGANEFYLESPLAWSGPTKPEVVLLDPAEGVNLPNASITSLAIEPEPMLGSRGFSFTFVVHNHSDRPLKDLPAALRVDGRVITRGTISVPAHGSSSKTLGFRFPEGGVVHGDVELAGDALEEDDLRYFVLHVPKEVRALIVDGAPSTVRLQDEAFFLDAALNAPGSPVHPTTVDADAFAENPIPPNTDLVMLLDVPALPPDRVAKVGAFVEAGGGLFVSLGPQVDPDSYAAMSPLLPRPLRLLKTAAERETPAAEAKAARLDRVDWSHPVLSVFAGETRESIGATRTYKYFLLEPAQTPPMQVLASYDDGAPALVETSRGKGRIALFTSSVAREWSDFPIRSGFLPLVQRLSGYLARSLDDRDINVTAVLQPRTLEAELQPLTGLTVTGPDGQPRLLAATAGGAMQVADTSLPGIYRVRGSAPPDDHGSPLDFAVNLDPRASDLTRASLSDLGGYLGSDVAAQAAARDQMAVRSRWPIWTVLLAVMVFAFLIEGSLLLRPWRA